MQSIKHSKALNVQLHSRCEKRKTKQRAFSLTMHKETFIDLDFSLYASSRAFRFLLLHAA